MSQTGNDTLPEESQTQPDVSEDVNTQQDENPETQQVETQGDESTTTEKPPKNFVPYTDLKKERERRKAAEAKLKNLQSSPSNDEEEGPEPSQDDEVKRDLREWKIERTLSKFPDLSGMQDEFTDFVDENPHYALEDAADLFRVRKGLIGGNRPGLESPTSGPKQASDPGYSPQEVEDMRKNQPRKYQQLLREGKLDKSIRYK